MPVLKFFVTNFSGTMKARKLKARINIYNNWMYCVYRIGVKGLLELCRFVGVQ